MISNQPGNKNMQLANKRVLVTGGSGFIGSHLTRRLLSMGAEVAITTKYNSVIDNIRIVDIWDKVKVIEVDLRNLDSLRQVSDFAPHVVFHLAAYNHVGDSFTHVAEAIDSNAKGTANLLQAYDKFERMVYISTSEVYGYQTEVPFIETMSPLPISPYSIGKYTGELYCRMLMEQMGMPITVIRPFNAFGPYQSTRAVISEMILTCIEGRTVYSTEGKQTREFNFVGNLVDGFILAAEVDKAVGKMMNIGSGKEIAICDLIKRIHELTNSSSELKIGAYETRPTEIWRMYADSNIARDTLGWSPQVSFDDGLIATIEWCKKYVQQYENRNSGIYDLAANSLTGAASKT